MSVTPTRICCLRAFEKARVRFSHDFLGNDFFVRLGPCWYDGRLGAEDSVFHALLGDGACQVRVAEALDLWRAVGRSMFDDIVVRASVNFGFVASGEWRRQCPAWMAAADLIEAFVPTPIDASVAGGKALEFWHSCDVVRRAAENWQKKFPDYFSRWDPSLIEHPAFL